MNKTTPAARHKARHYAMQALYQWQLSDMAPHTIAQEFREDNDMTHVDVEYFEELLNSVVKQHEELDASYSDYLQDRSLTELDPITLALLRIGSYELKHRIDVPFKVVISEAVGLAKKFGAAESHKFVNGVLDRSAETLRAVEVTSTR